MEAKTPMFTKRHHEWLAAWAKHNLRVEDRIALRNALAQESRLAGTSFDERKFDKATGADEYLAGVDALCKSTTPRGDSMSREDWFSAGMESEHEAQRTAAHPDGKA